MLQPSSRSTFSCVLHNSPRHFVHLSVCPSVRWLVGWLVGWLNSWSPFYFIGISELFWAHCFCPNALVKFFISAPAHSSATGAAVSPALLVKTKVCGIKQFSSFGQWSWRGRSPVKHRGTFVRPFVYLFLPLPIRPLRPQIWPLRPQIQPLASN